jgi:hypothetical protein
MKPDIPLPARYSYRCGLTSLFMASWTVGMFGISALCWKDHDHDAVVLFFLFLFGGLFFSLGTAIFLLSMSDIVVAEEGLSWQVMKLTWRRLRWDQMRSVRIKGFLETYQNYDVTVPLRGFRDAYKSYQMTQYTFDTGKTGLFRNPPRLRDDIEYYGEVIRLLNHFIEMHNIPIVSDIKGSEGRVARLTGSEASPAP